MQNNMPCEGEIRKILFSDCEYYYDHGIVKLHDGFEYEIVFEGIPTARRDDSNTYATKEEMMKAVFGL